jgi:CheY-like chemotaxis protein
VSDLGSGARVLIVDDDPDLRQILSAILAAEGYGVVAAGSGPEALGALARESSPSLILLDLRMPEMSGEDFKARLDVDPRWSAIPVLVLSGDADAVHVARGMRVRGVIQKPVDLHVLLKVIAAAVGVGSPEDR